MVECLVQHFVEADRVDEEASVDTVDAGNLNIHTVKKQPVDRVALKGQFLRGFQYDSRDIKMFSICQCLIDPGLDYARIQNIACVFHRHYLLNSVLKRIIVGLFIGSDALGASDASACDLVGAHILHQTGASVSQHST